MCTHTHTERKFHWKCEALYDVATSQADECHCREAAVSLCCKDKTSHYPWFYFGIIKVNKHFSATMSASRASIKHSFAEILDGSNKTHFFYYYHCCLWNASVSWPDQTGLGGYWWGACGMDNHCSRPDFSLSHKQVKVFIAAVKLSVPVFRPGVFSFSCTPRSTVGASAALVGSSSRSAWRASSVCSPTQKGPRGHGYQASSPPLGVKVRGSRQNISAALWASGDPV